MNNFDTILKEAIDKIKMRWDLPEKGFLTGGSIANIIWELVSGKEAIVNDLDIFLYDSKEKYNFDDFIINTKERVIFENYSGLTSTIYDKHRYAIQDVIRDGIFNFITYTSNVKDPLMIIQSFDINSCQVGYDIESDTFYHTKEFREFIETGKLKLTSLSTPAHSAIRLVKKAEDLGVDIPESELDILEIVLGGVFPSDLDRVRFKSKYAEMYKQYEDKLKHKFILKRDSDSEKSIKEIYGHQSELYHLTPVKKEKRNYFVALSKEMLFWFRNIYKKETLENAWKNVWLIFDIDNDNYLDIEVDESKLTLLNNVIKFAPNAIANLKGLKISKQIEIIDKLFSIFKDYPITAVSILETTKNLDKIDFENEIELDMLKISIRKTNFARKSDEEGEKFIIDPKNKVGKIFGEKHVNNEDIKHFPHDNCFENPLPF